MIIGTNDINGQSEFEPPIKKPLLAQEVFEKELIPFEKDICHGDESLEDDYESLEDEDLQNGLEIRDRKNPGMTLRDM
jgi:hypothetical protein